jgi:hypothetical protein
MGGHRRPRADPGGSLVRMAMMRAATRWVALVAAERMLSDAHRAREEGKGRRPSQAMVNQLAKRAGLEDDSYQKALASLREQVNQQRRARTPDEILAEVHQSLKQGDDDED